MVRKKSKQRIFLSWLLLTFFAAGQVIVYSHQHHSNAAASLTKTSHQLSRQTISDTCPLCDAMHFNHMALTSQVYTWDEQESYHLFAAGHYDFVSISLILSTGRAPPVS